MPSLISCAKFNKTLFKVIYATKGVLPYILDSGYDANSVIYAEKSFMKSATGLFSVDNHLRYFWANTLAYYRMFTLRSQNNLQYQPQIDFVGL